MKQPSQASVSGLEKFPTTNAQRNIETLKVLQDLFLKNTIDNNCLHKLAGYSSLFCLPWNLIFVEVSRLKASI